MAGFFSGIGLVRRFLAPFNDKPSVGNLNINKINLLRSISVPALHRFALLAFLLFGGISASIADGPFSTCPFHQNVVHVDNYYSDRYSANAACVADSDAGVNSGCGWSLYNPPGSLNPNAPPTTRPSSRMSIRRAFGTTEINALITGYIVTLQPVAPKGNLSKVFSDITQMNTPKHGLSN